MELGAYFAHLLHETVKNGELGVDYTFDLYRDKNQNLRRKYCITDEKMREILLQLDKSNYIESRPSNNPTFPNDIVHIFMIVVDLMPRYIVNAEYEKVSLYIKVVWPDGEGPMFIISFHEADEFD